MCIHNFDIERIDWDIKDLFGHIRNEPQENKSSYVLDWKNAISILLNNSALLLASSFFVKKEMIFYAGTMTFYSVIAFMSLNLRKY